MDHILVIELGPDGGYWAALEGGDLDGAPVLGAPTHGSEQELQDGLLAKGVEKDLVGWSWQIGHWFEVYCAG